MESSDHKTQHLCRSVSYLIMSTHFCDVYVKCFTQKLHKFYVYFIDDTPPVIHCPRDKMLETDVNEATATVSWKVPDAIDNSVTGLPDVSVIPAMVPPVLLPIGTTHITYVAEDDSKNTKKCRFRVTVRGKYR